MFIGGLSNDLPPEDFFEIFTLKKSLPIQVVQNV